MNYETHVKIEKAVFNDINRKLSLPYFDEMDEEEFEKSGAEMDECIGIFGATFENGSSFTYDLCSGGENYYDNMVFTDPEGYEYYLECDFELDDRIEFDKDNDHYVIIIETY